MLEERGMRRREYEQKDRAESLMRRVASHSRHGVPIRPSTSKYISWMTHEVLPIGFAGRSIGIKFPDPSSP
jgi:hypothetical protein